MHVIQRGSFIDPEPSRDKPKKPVYQVWHDKNWNRAFGIAPHAPEPVFPRDYYHVANVAAKSAFHAVELTTDANHDLMAPRPLVENLGGLDRDTGKGDVIVTPSGKPYRFEGETFTALTPEGAQEKAVGGRRPEDYARTRSTNDHTLEK